MPQDSPPRIPRRARQPRGGTTARGAKRRAELIAVAALLFADRGYRGVGVGEVAQRAGITEPGLLYHFGTKEGLLHAVIDQRDAASREFAAELARIGGVDAIRQLPAFARRNQAAPHLVRLFAVLLAENLDPAAPAHDHFVTRYRQLRADIAGILGTGRDRGEFRADLDPGVKALEILAFIDGLHTQWLLDPEAIDLTGAVESYAVALVRDLTDGAGG
ncbi:TetR/AcrR family transcriptional regulator [Streptomyces sp. NPDC091279]|uniref:TetR/AcrR family transcriptional regulator n=1 Tax=Streptomyces sp. NPDC091279 TaxID=3365983 RepID=UPI003817549A